jgi:hypothetical protein
VQAHVSPAEWAAIEKNDAKGAYTFRETLQALPWVLRDVPAAQRRGILDLGGLPFRLIWRLTRRPSDRRERAAFRYAWTRDAPGPRTEIGRYV